MHTRFYSFVPSAGRLFFYVDTRTTCTTCTAMSLTDTLTVCLLLSTSLALFCISFFFFFAQRERLAFPSESTLQLLAMPWEGNTARPRSRWLQVPGYNIAVDKFPLLDTEEYNIKYTYLLFNMYIVYRIKEKNISPTKWPFPAHATCDKNTSTPPRPFLPPTPRTRKFNPPANLQSFFTFLSPIVERFS